MSNLEDIKVEIIDAIRERKKGRLSDSEIGIIKKELDILSETDGVGNKNNLETFYNIWLKYDGQCGTRNDKNSWTAYHLGLTSKKPDDDNFLPSKRAFARASFPDIDTDFEFAGQAFLFDYLIEKYGRDYAGRIGNHGFLAFKSCVARVSKSLDLADAYKLGQKEYISRNEEFVRRILEPFPVGSVVRVQNEQGDLESVKGIDDAVRLSPEFRRNVKDYPELVEHCRNIGGIFGSFSTHAAGIVLSDTPLSEIVPLRKCTDGSLSTQFPGSELEALGLIKFDILGLLTLSVLHFCLNYIKENYDLDLNLENIPRNDAKALALYRKGNLAGVFQCENYGMIQTMKSIGVDRFEDIMVGISLYRPGPMSQIPEYCDRKHGRSPINYFHPVIEKYTKPILDVTYGVLCYQEQIMQICSSLAGLSVTDGYIMIKAIGKKVKDLMSKYEDRFIQGGVDKGVDQYTMKNYWDTFIVPFSEYGFNACLSGSMRIKNKIDNKFYSLSRIEYLFRKNEQPKIVLDSYLNGELVEDEVVDVFKTGVKDIYLIDLSNKMQIKSTLDHRFLCDDGQFRTVAKILRDNYAFYFSDGKRVTINTVYLFERDTTYNLTMKSKQHNYMIYNESDDERSIISKNSHSCCYALISYYCAYLKANYPDEFVLASLNVQLLKTGDKFDKIDKLQKDFERNLDIVFLDPSINKSKSIYYISRKKDVSKGIMKTEIIKPLLCKGLGIDAAREIEKKQPFKNFEDFVRKVDNKIINARSIAALVENNVIKNKKQENLVEKYNAIKSESKRMKQAKMKIVDIF